MSTSKNRRKTRNEVIALDSPRDYETCASRLKALADHERLRIVMRLLRGELSVSALAADLDAPVDKISHHLGILRAANLVQSRKQGKYVIYSLGSEILDSMAAMQAAKSIDLGCCQLDLVQQRRPATGKQAAARKRAAGKAKPRVIDR